MLIAGHMCSLIMMGDSADAFDWTTFNFFTVQSVGLLLEKSYKKITGSRVDGLPGRLWTGVWFMATSAAVCESNIRRICHGMELMYFKGTPWVRLAMTALDSFPRQLSLSYNISQLLI